MNTLSGMEEAILQSSFSPGEQFLLELFWKCRQYNIVQCWRLKKVHMLSPADSPGSSVYIHLTVTALSTSLRGSQQRCSPGQQICPLQHSSNHIHWLSSKSTEAVLCNLTFKLKNFPTCAETVLHLGRLPRCQGSRSKFSLRAPERGPRF